MSSINELLKNSVNNMDYYVIRSENASVFVAQIDEIDHKNRYAKLKNARRIWYWDGAASLSELSVEGVSKPQNCKFPVPVESILVYEIIEILPMTERAIISIHNVPIWSEK